ncbi:uncharacterized protein MONBRDRAFT_10917 [Monosiga brevicollis MX1]|uniref:Protein kinase domain-containing protein n=1 Tax=Monosiga brevicollis TaxID=81824 RepID=A9V7M3_MONBE|nr:uncharacterized protein MONBRDRAFT_10917 [Monosiga brevicollis MX1]EDQ86330.1 predicted protein [Monosiga brevicollis MX1]|eukprot:XP_001748720.1 hypothetical protein [Monosiga brevicollis MX1]
MDTEEQANAKVKVAEAELGVAKAKVKVAKAKLGVAEANVEAATNDKDRARTESSVAKAEVNVAKAEVNVAKAEVNVAKANLGVAEAKVEAATNDRDRARAESSVAKAEVNVAKAEVNVAKAEVNVAKAEVNVAKAEVNVAKANLGVAEAKVEAATNDRDRARAESSVANAKLKVAEAEVNVAKANLGVAEANVAEARLGVAEAKVEAATNEKDQARAESSVANARVNVAEAKVNLAILSSPAELSDVSKSHFDILNNEVAHACQARDKAASKMNSPMAAAVSPRPQQSSGVLTAPASAAASAASRDGYLDYYNQVTRQGRYKTADETKASPFCSRITSEQTIMAKSIPKGQRSSEDALQNAWVDFLKEQGENIPCHVFRNIACILELKRSTKKFAASALGQLFSYLNTLLKLSPRRDFCFGALVNCFDFHIIRAYRCQETGDTHFETIMADDLQSGAPLVRLLTMEAHELGFVDLRVTIPDNDGRLMDYHPHCFIGEGRHCKAYKGWFQDKPAVFKIFEDEAVMKQERDMLNKLKLAKVRNVPVFKGCSEGSLYCCVVTPVGKKFITPPTRNELSMLLDVLKAAHKAGVVHRDPLPRNYFRVDSAILFNDWGSAEEICKGRPVLPAGWPCEQAADMIDEVRATCCSECGKNCSVQAPSCSTGCRLQGEVVPQFRQDLEMFAKGIFLRMSGWPNDLHSTDFWEKGRWGFTWQPVLNAASLLPDFITEEDSPEDFVRNHEGTYENFRNTLLEYYDRLLPDAPSLHNGRRP